MTQASPASGTPNPGAAPSGAGSADLSRGSAPGMPATGAPAAGRAVGTPAPAPASRPPAGAGPGSAASPAERSSLGLHARTAAALCYAAAWIGGLVFLAFERQSRFVRFHAWQSVLALGGLFLLGTGLWTLGMLMVFVSTGAFRALAWLSQIAWVAMGATWLVMMVSAFTGRRLRLPVVGKTAERWSVLRSR